MKKILSLVVLMVLSTFVFAQSGDDILGVWLTEGGKSKVKITKVDGKYNGEIIWLKEPLRDGKPRTDIHNEDSSKHKNPIVGLKLINGFEWDDDEYEEGNIYDPENGKTYSCEITYDGIDKLNVRGYIGFSLLGRTTYWTRVK